MRTSEERLATIEAELRELRQSLGALLELVNSGPSVPWDQSIRGRLHHMRNSVLAAEQLAQAAREVRRAQRRQWSLAERVLLAAAALAAAAAPYVVLLIH